MSHKLSGAEAPATQPVYAATASPGLWSWQGVLARQTARLGNLPACTEWDGASELAAPRRMATTHGPAIPQRFRSRISDLNVLLRFTADSYPKSESASLSIQRFGIHLPGRSVSGGLVKCNAELDGPKTRLGRMSLSGCGLAGIEESESTIASKVEVGADARDGPAVTTSPRG